MTLFYFTAPLYTIADADLLVGVLRPLLHATLHMAHLLLQLESYNEPVLFYIFVYLHSEADLLEIELLRLRGGNNKAES